MYFTEPGISTRQIRDFDAQDNTSISAVCLSSFTVGFATVRLNSLLLPIIIGSYSRLCVKNCSRIVCVSLFSYQGSSAQSLRRWSKSHANRLRRWAFAVASLWYGLQQQVLRPVLSVSLSCDSLLILTHLIDRVNIFFRFFSNLFRCLSRQLY